MVSPKVASLSRGRLAQVEVVACWPAASSNGDGSVGYLRWPGIRRRGIARRFRSSWDQAKRKRKAPENKRICGPLVNGEERGARSGRALSWQVPKMSFCVC
jgi:hypothetical protein